MTCGPSDQHRPKTAAGVLHPPFPSPNNVSSLPLRRTPTSVDLSQTADFAHKIGETSLSDDDDDQHQQQYQSPSPQPEPSRSTPLHGISRTISHVKKDLIGIVRNRIPKMTSTKAGRANPRRHHEHAAATSSSNASTSPPGLRRESNRRPRMADRPRRNAVSLSSGPPAFRAGEESPYFTRLQASQTWVQALRCGQGAKAAVAATRKQRLEEAVYRQEHAQMCHPPSPDSGNDSAMELDSAFGDVSQDEDMQGVEIGLSSSGEENLILKVLPGEIFLEILEYLDFVDLGNAARVCKTWHQFANSPTVLRAAFMRKYRRRSSIPTPHIQIGGQGIGRLSDPLQNWKAMAKARKDIQENWENASPKAIYFEGHTDSVYCCQFDEDKIITGSRDRTIRVWDPHTYKCVKVIGGPAYKPTAPVTNERLSTVYSTVHAGENVNGTKEGDRIFHVPSEHHAASILCLQYDHEILVTGSSDHTCLVWNIETYEPIARLRHHSAGVLDVCLDKDYIVSCSKDLTICVWSRRTYELVKVLSGHTGPVNAVQLRGGLLASASGDGRCKLWDLRGLENKRPDEILVRTFQSADRGLAAVEFTDDMEYVLAGGNDQVIYKFRCSDGAEVDKYTGHSGLVRSLFLDYANRRVLSGSYDQEIRVYDFDSHDTVGAYENWTTSWILAAKSDYRRIVATSQDSRVLLMDFGLDVENAHLLNGNNKEAGFHRAIVQDRKKKTLMTWGFRRDRPSDVHASE